MKVNNKSIREVQEKYHLYGYQIARILNMSESTYGRMMRCELPEDEQQRIIQIIEEHEAKAHDGEKGS